MKIYVSSGDVVTPGELVAEGKCEVVGPYFRLDKKLFAKMLSIAITSKNSIRLIPLKRTYIPIEGDIVIGKVIDVNPMSWLVDINSPYNAILQVSEVFPKPTTVRRDLSEILKVGDLLIAKILSFDLIHDPLLTIKESKLGKVTKGSLVEILPSRVSRIIGRKGKVVNMIRKTFSAEIVVGRNGRILVVGKDSDTEGMVAYIIKKISEESFIEDPVAYTKQLLDQVKASIGE